MIKFQGYCVVIVLTIILCSSFVQIGTAYYSTRTFDTSSYEWPEEIISCSDGGFAIAGTAYIGYPGFLLIKTDRYGGLDWIHTYRTNDYASCSGLVECADGGFALVGQIHNEIGWIVRTNPYGAPLWNLTISEEGTSNAALSDVVELPSGDLLAAGYIRSKLLNHTDAWLVNIDENGTLKWSMAHGKIYQNQLCKSLILCQNGDVLMAVDTGDDFWMLRTTSSGTRLWQKTFHFEGNQYFYSAIETHDGGFVLTGQWERQHVEAWNSWMFLLRTDSMGNLMWNKTYSGSGVHHDPDGSHDHEDTIGIDVVECDDKGLAIAGTTDCFANNYENIWVVKTDEGGNPIWNYTLVRNSFDSPISMAKQGNTSFAIVAETRESIAYDDYDILFTMLDDESPHTSSTTTTSQGFNGILTQAFVVVGIGAGAVLIVVFYHRYRRR